MSRYIDADTLERFLHRDEWGTPDERWRPESEFGQFVDGIPTAYVVPMQGTRCTVGWWIEKRSNQVGSAHDTHYECCECHHLYLAPTNFCPNCGTDMRSHIEWERRSHGQQGV